MKIIITFQKNDTTNFISLYFFPLETRFHIAHTGLPQIQYVAADGFELLVILPLLPEYWDSGHVMLDLDHTSEFVLCSLMSGLSFFVPEKSLHLYVYL